VISLALLWVSGFGGGGDPAAMASRVKEDERHEKIIRGLLKLPANKRCINCNNLVSLSSRVLEFSLAECGRVFGGRQRASGQVGAFFSLFGFIRHNALLPRMAPHMAYWEVAAELGV